MLKNLSDVELKKRAHKGAKKMSVLVRNRKAIFKVGLGEPNREKEKEEGEDRTVEDIARLKRERSSSSSEMEIGNW